MVERPPALRNTNFERLGMLFGYNFKLTSLL